MRWSFTVALRYDQGQARADRPADRPHRRGNLQRFPAEGLAGLEGDRRSDVLCDLRRRLQERRLQPAAAADADVPARRPAGGHDGLPSCGAKTTWLWRIVCRSMRRSITQDYEDVRAYFQARACKPVGPGRDQSERGADCRRRDRTVGAAAREYSRTDRGVRLHRRRSSPTSTAPACSMATGCPIRRYTRSMRPRVSSPLDNGLGIVSRVDCSTAPARSHFADRERRLSADLRHGRPRRSGWRPSLRQ